jgi:hypothetical protein
MPGAFAGKIRARLPINITTMTGLLQTARLILLKALVASIGRTSKGLSSFSRTRAIDSTIWILEEAAAVVALQDVPIAISKLYRNKIYKGLCPEASAPTLERVTTEALKRTAFAICIQPVSSMIQDIQEYHITDGRQDDAGDDPDDKSRKRK